MKKNIFTLSAIIAALFLSGNVSAQVSNYFTTEADLANWKGAQGTISIVDGTMQLAVEGDFWATASYEPAGGFDWNFDNNKVVCIKLQKKKGDLQFKFFDGANYLMVDKNPIAIDGTTELIHVFNTEDYPDYALTGTKHFTNMQIANEYVGPGDLLNFDWIKSFNDIEKAYEFIGIILEGGDPTRLSNNEVNPAFQAIGGKGIIKLSGMNESQMLQVIDISGHTLINQSRKNGIIDQLNSGLYLVKAADKTIKVVVQ